MNRRAELYAWLLIVMTALYWTGHVVAAAIRGTLTP